MPQNNRRGGQFTGPGRIGGPFSQQSQDEAAEAERQRAAGVKTSVRTPKVVAESIQRRGPRSGIEVTRPTENKFLTGPNVTGVNELGSDQPTFNNRRFGR